MTVCADRGRAEHVLPLDPPVPPGWVARCISAPVVESEAALSEGATIRVGESGELSLLRATVPGAKSLPDREFRSCVERTYLAIGELLRQRGRAPLRLWNYVPGIGARGPSGLSRYELFNLGRYLAYTAWYETDQFGERLAAASAVDHRGDDLVVHVLAGSKPGNPLENPRQTPAYSYSRRYGPLPPCFSRATIVPRPLGVGTPWAIVAGTSSIVGEDTRHAGDCEAQLDETILNLSHLSAAFAGDPPSHGAFAAEERSRALARFRHLRVYVVREGDAGVILQGLRRACPEVDEIEAFSANLCRPDLLVEVEGVLGGRAGAGARL